MNRSIVIGVIGILLGIIGLAYAIYQSYEREKLSAFVRSEAWYLYQKSSLANATTQEAFALYKKTYPENPNTQIIEALAKADAFGQDVHKEVIRQIQLSEPDFSRAKVEKWIQLGKLYAPHRPFFEQLCIDEKESANKASEAIVPQGVAQPQR